MPCHATVLWHRAKKPVMLHWLWEVLLCQQITIFNCANISGVLERTLIQLFPVSCCTLWLHLCYQDASLLMTPSITNPRCPVFRLNEFECWDIDNRSMSGANQSLEETGTFVVYCISLTTTKEHCLTHHGSNSVSKCSRKDSGSACS